MDNKVVTRFAPSPTGELHIGGVRTALFNFLFASHNGGKFILRSEDTDKERSKKEFEDNILEAFKWLGLSYDEFYRQSERGEIYKKYLKQLIDNGSAYISKEEIKEEGDRAEVIRFKNPNKKIKFNDIILGEIEFDTTDLKDFVIAKDLDTPLYHLAVVVDDFEMGVTHVIRAQEHLSNTPRQILIQEALNAPRPNYAHIPLVLAPDKSKLSKRHGAMSVLAYKEMGYLPEAILNFMAMIGWNPGDEQEIFTLDELVKKFELEKVQKGGGVFNVEKLDWINKEHIKKLSPEEIKENIFKWMPEDMQKSKIAPKLVPLIFERISKWSDVAQMAEEGEFHFFFKHEFYEVEKLNYKNLTQEQTSTNINAAIKALEDIKEENFNKENIKIALMQIADALGSRGELLHPVRFALSARDRSPDPFIIAEILGKSETILRLQKAVL